MTQDVAHPFAADDRRPRDTELHEAGQHIVDLFFVVDHGDEQLHSTRGRQGSEVGTATPNDVRDQVRTQESERQPHPAIDVPDP